MASLKPIQSTRKRVIQAILQPAECRRVSIRPVTHQVIGGVLWAVMEEIRKDESATSRFLSCSLLFQHRECWSYLTYTEADFCNLYNCPLNYLAMVPEPINAAWRDHVRSFHAMMASPDILRVA